MEKLDNTAERTALWRALHLEIDAEPLLIKDNWALKLARPAPGWQQRPDMKYTQPIRASIVGRARFVEDQVEKAIEKGTTQYVVLGAGLDSFALRHQEGVSSTKREVQIFEIDQPGTLTWKAACIREQIKNIPDNLHLVPVDFEKTTWWEALGQPWVGFDFVRPTVISCTGVTLYLSLVAIGEMLQHIAQLAPGSMAIISFYAPLEDLKASDRTLMEMSIKGAAAAGTPMISFFNAPEVIRKATAAGLSNCQYFSTADLIRQYFTGRSDGLLPSEGELFLVAEV